jgi:ABC-type glycerol-3-phosphate transport system substrate-binding protein
MHPGSRPFEELEAALLRATGEPVAGLVDVLEGGRRGLVRAVKRLTPEGRRIVVVVDQFEELYELATAERRARFEAVLAEAAGDDELPLVVLVGLRADFYDRPLADPALAALFGAGTVAVPPLGPTNLERAISGPAQRVGVTVEPELEARIMTDVLDRPGELPLFQFALTEVFDHRKAHRVGVAEYEAVGGVDGALVTTAEGLHDAFHAASRAALRRTLLGLVTVQTGGQTRRRATLAEMDGPDVEPVLRALDEHRLITFDRDPASGEATVEVAHESLFDAWPRLAAWIDEQRDDLRMRERLAAAARDWEESGRDAGYLLSGSRLQQTAAWAEGSELAIPERDLHYLGLGITAAAEAAAAEAARLERERALERRSRLRARVIGVTTAVAVVVAGLAAFAWSERNQAQDLAAEIDRVRLATDYAVASMNTLETDPELGALYAVESVRVTGEADGTVLATAVDAAHWAMQAARIEYPATDAPPLVRSGPGGLRGIFDLPPDYLVDHLLEQIDRRLTSEECEAVAGGTCLPPYTGFTRTLDIVGRTPSVPDVDPARPLAGTIVQVGIMESFVFEAFEAATGIQIEDRYVAEDEVEAAVRGGTLPDAWFLPQPGRLPEYVEAGWLVDVGSYLPNERLEELYGPDLAGLVTVGPNGEFPADQGFVAGVWSSVNVKNLLWYRADIFEAEGYTVPSTWPDAERLAVEMIADGHTPWCLRIGEEGPYTGWPGTDWVEVALIHSAGPELYEDWAFHRIPFDSPAVLAAAGTFTDIMSTAGAVSHSGMGVLGFYAGSVRQLTEEPPECLMMHMPSFAPNLGVFSGFGPEVLDDLGVIRMPPTDLRFRDAAVISGNVAVAFSDRPEVRAFMEWVAGPEYAAAQAEDGVTLVASREFDLLQYPAERQRLIAGWLREAQAARSVRFDASDLMPPLIGSGTWLEEEGYFQAALFYEAMMTLVDAPDRLEETFAEVETAWQQLESGQATGS